MLLGSPQKRLNPGMKEQEREVKTPEYKHPPHRKGKCAICRTPVSPDSVCCAACSSEYFMHADQIVAEDMMREALKQPGFRGAVAKWCAEAAIHGPITLRFKNGKFYRLEKPLDTEQEEGD
jgi:hypothetical protein